LLLGELGELLLVKLIAVLLEELLVLVEELVSLKAVLLDRLDEESLVKLSAVLLLGEEEE
jgi:hypothetical protein